MLALAPSIDAGVSVVWEICWVCRSFGYGVHIIGGHKEDTVSLDTHGVEL